MSRCDPLAAPLRQALAEAIARELPARLPGLRWFGGKGRRLAAARLVDAGGVGDAAAGLWLTLAEVTFADGAPELYSLPLAIRPAAAAPRDPLLRLEAAGRALAALDALDDPAAGAALLDAFAGAASVSLARGGVRFSRTAAFPAGALPAGPARRLGGEQSNTSLAYGDLLVLKALRRVEPGPHPEAELAGFLALRAGFAHVPALAGTLEYDPPGGAPVTLGILQRFVPSRGDGWTHALAHLRELRAALEGQAAPDPADVPGTRATIRRVAAGFLRDLERLGEVTGGLHAALASDPGDPAVAPEPITPADGARWAEDAEAEAGRALADLRNALPTLPGPARETARALLARAPSPGTDFGALRSLPGADCAKIRIHGDYHLGQVLRTDDGFVLLDLEGEPARPLAERRAKHCPLRDVAGMLRSLDYAAAAGGGAAEDVSPEPPGAGWIREWTALAREAFLAGYTPAAGRSPVRLLPAAAGTGAAALRAWEVAKAYYEIRYELGHRPAWVPVPLRGLAALLAAGGPGA
jgi:trehalose synthase-fused probable maltokinase